MCDITWSLSMIVKYEKVKYTETVNGVLNQISVSKYSKFSFNRIAMFDNVNKSDYYTVSTHAVMHYYGSEVDYLPLERWEQEYQFHRKLLRIPVFFLFRKWKAFRVWRANVRNKKISKCIRSLQEHLFILNEVCQSLLYVNLYRYGFNKSWYLKKKKKNHDLSKRETVYSYNEVPCRMHHLLYEKIVFLYFRLCDQHWLTSGKCVTTSVTCLCVG